MNKLILKIISLVLMRLLLWGDIAIAADSFSVKSEKPTLSPRICIDNFALSNMFVNGLPKILHNQTLQDDFKAKSSWLEKITEYALRKKKENIDKGLFGQNIIYLVFKQRVDRLENHSKPYNPKTKQKKELLKDVNRLKRLLSERRKWIKPDLAREYDNQLNSLEPLLSAVKTQGDWDDLMALGSRLNKVLSKHGALATELAALGTKNKKERKQNRMKGNNPGVNRSQVLPEKMIEPMEEIAGQLLPDSDQQIDEVEISQPNIPESNVLAKDSPRDAGLSGEFVPTTVSARKPVLLIAIKKLIEIYNAAHEQLSSAAAVDFQEKIERLQQNINSARKGEFRVLKNELRAIEADLLKAIAGEKANQVVLPEIKTKEITNPRVESNENPRLANVKKQAKPIDQFSQAVTLYDPEKVPIRSIEEVSTELQGQIALLDQIIDAEMHSSMELPVYNARLDSDGLVIQVNFSDALEKVEVGSDIIMELNGEYYSLKCAKILNSGSKLLLRPAKGVFPDDFPLDASKGKFVYMPSTYIEEMEKSALEEINIKIKSKDKTTGIKVLDYLLRIKAAVQDIEDIEELKKTIAYSDGLDMFQKAAINMIVKTKFGLVLGPFGTGKTSVLLAGAKNIILNKKQAVFIIAPQHKIADDICLKAGDCHIPVVRCGNNITKINPEVLEKYSRHSEAAREEFMRRYKQLNTKDEDNGCLFVGTDMGTSLDLLVNQLRNPESEKYLKNVTLIVDEAALINYPELITAIYMLRPNALILAGDHVQFSPYKLAARFSSQIMALFKKNIPQKAIYRYHISSFKELIAMPFNKVSLLVNYRNPWISVDLLQDWYKGVLNLQSISKQKGERIEEDTFVIEDTSTWEKQSFAEKYQYGNSLCNKTEALWILKRIKYFLAKEENKAKDISIITYYNGQIRLISDLIDADGDISIRDAQILKQNIFTPISFQGGENKILLASLVMSENPNSNNGRIYITKKSNPVFLSEPEYAKAEALLVLLSRHKGKLSVIGNRETLDALTKQRYPRVNYLYLCLFNQKNKIKACMDVQNIELTKSKVENINWLGFVQSAI
jgi:hypothetical protein